LRPYEIVTSADRLPAVAAEVLKAPAVALDLETAKIGGGGSVDPLTGRIRICSLNTGENRYVIDLYKTGAEAFKVVADALNDTKAVVVGQNLKFDQKWLLWHYDVEFKKVFDTFRASHVVYAGRQGLQHDLWSIYMRELKEKPEIEDLAASDWDATELTAQQYDYAADDVDKLLRLREVLKAKLVKDGLVKIAQLEFQAILPEASIELNGLRLDKELWLHRCKQDEARARALEAIVREGIPNPVAQQGLFAGFTDAAFNIDSNDQLLASLRKMGVKQTVVDPETYAKSVVPLQDTKEMTLAMLADNWPILSKIIEYRGYSKNCTSFGPDYLKHIHPVTDRIHCSYFPYTTSGRYACQSPNLQQTPRAKAFRECFKVQFGYKLAICVEEGTRVATTRGLIAIEDLNESDRVVVEDGSTHTVRTLIDRGVQQVVSVETALGYTLVCTPQHRIRVRDRDGNYVWREAGSLQEQDAIAIQAGRGLASSNAQLPSIGEPRPYEKSVRVPEVATAAFATLCGYLTGDGTFQRNYVGFVVNAEDRDVSNLLRQYVETELGRLPPPVREEKGVLDTRLGSMGLLRWCEANGVNKNQVPDFVWQSSSDVAAAWLRGLFEADGCVSGRTVIVRSVSERLLKETQELLLSLGILSSRTLTEHGLAGVGHIWNLRVVSESVPLFEQIIGFMSVRKKQRLATLSKTLLESRKSSDGASLPNVRSTLQAKKLSDNTALLLRNSKHRNRLGIKTARRLWESDREMALALGVDHVLERQTYFDTVQSVLPSGEAHVYDIEVPGPHAYVSAGFVSHNCDWSNVEMRLAAEISGDKMLIKVFQDDKDAHYVTAGLMTGKPKEKITKDERQQAKPVNFGFIYGMSAAKLVLYAKASYGVNLTEGQARKFRKAFFEGYSGIAGWHEFALESGKRMKETRTLWGRRRSFFGNDKAHNEYLNTPVQGSGADALKNSIRIIYDKCRALNGGKPPLLGKGAVVGMVHMVHDEIILEHKDDPEIEKAAQKALHEGMLEGLAPMLPRVPAVAEVGGGDSWASK
jgi:DNA polymerase I-like protein with 3'-5' exonuclease and polymerase domains/intein/homing endonuclease